MIRVVLVDDHAAVRAGLKVLLQADPTLDVVGEAADGAQAVELVTALRPDVVVMDLQMPVVDGIEATRRLVAAGLGPVVVLTTYGLDDLVDRALAAGAAGFLVKTATAEALCDGIRRIAAGESVLSPEVTRGVIDRLLAARAVPLPAAPPAQLADLTPREIEVLRRLGHGDSNAAIAAALVITEATAKSHVSSILTKLGVTSRVQAALMARHLR